MVRVSFLCLGVTLFSCATSVVFKGQITGVSRDSGEIIGSGVETPIVNGVNFASRIDVVFHQLAAESTEQVCVPVNEKYSFEAELLEGEYQLEISSHDFKIEKNRYKVVVAGDKVTTFESPLAAPLNETSACEVSESKPLIIQTLGLLQYYESSEGRLTAMLMSSPLGAIFRNRTYMILFVMSLVIMAAPTVLSYLSPELAAEFNQARVQANTEKGNGKTGIVAPAESINPSSTTTLSGALRGQVKKRK